MVSPVLFNMLPVVFVFSKLGNIDIGLLLSIHIGILVFIFYSIAISFLISVLFKKRIVQVSVSISILLFSRMYSSFLIGCFKGLISINQIVSLILLSITILVISKSLLAKTKNIFKITFALIIFLISLLIPGNIDLTWYRSHSISAYTKKLINSSPENININFYLSDEITNLTETNRDMIKILNQFGSLDNCNFEILPANESLEHGSTQIRYTDRYFNLPPNTSIKGFEFEVLKVINYLQNNGLKKVGILIGNEEYSIDNFKMLEMALRDHFSINFIYPEEVIPNDLDSLIVVGHYSISPHVFQKIGNYLSRGGNILFAGTGLPTNEGLNYRNTEILTALNLCGVIIEPYLIGNNSQNRLNIITYPNREYKSNLITVPFTGFTGTYTSPINILNNIFINLLYSSNDSWLVSSISEIDGVPESRFPVAVYGEGNFSKFFSGKDLGNINRFIILGSSMSLTDYPYSLGEHQGYDFIIRSIYKIISEEELLNVRYNYNLENNFYMLESSRYRNTVFNFLFMFIIIFYPFLIFLVFRYIKKKLR